MTNNSLRGVLLAGAAAVAGFWLWQPPEGLIEALTAVGAAVLAVGVALWLARMVAARRLRAALDDYAERALTREKRRQPKRAASRVA